MGIPWVVESMGQILRVAHIRAYPPDYGLETVTVVGCSPGAGSSPMASVVSWDVVAPSSTPDISKATRHRFPMDTIRVRIRTFGICAIGSSLPCRHPDGPVGY